MMKTPFGTDVTDVVIPAHATGVVLFAHGDGSGRFGSRHRQVAGALQRAGLATVLADLLAADEAPAEEDIGLLGGRLVQLVEWTRQQAALAALDLGLFGAGAGAAVSIEAAARRPDDVQAIVSRGGRPDLADASLPSVRSPTLLIVGAMDEAVLDLNRQAFLALQCEKRLEIVPRATHLFQEAGALEAVASLARHWFLSHLGARPAGA